MKCCRGSPQKHNFQRAELSFRPGSPPQRRPSGNIHDAKRPRGSLHETRSARQALCETGKALETLRTPTEVRDECRGRGPEHRDLQKAPYETERARRK